MDQDVREKLSQTLELAEENNHMLHAMRRAQRFAAFISVLKWLIIIGSTVGFYYYFQPQIQTLVQLNSDIWNTIGSARDTLQNFNQQLSK